MIALEPCGWTIQPSQFILVDHEKANIVGRNLLPQIGLKIILEKRKQYRMLSIRATEKSNSEVQQWVKLNFKQLCIRIGKKLCYANTMHKGRNLNSAKKTPDPNSPTKKGQKRTKQTDC